ncbi:hypothetical protein PZH32_13830, partial [Adlercreutzia equolifaciens]|uniref:hypothetical protein n=1 Tax=Adlercreutzia equolifaciens TaxID=446660 RepID=UPI0023AE9DEE
PKVRTGSYGVGTAATDNAGGTDVLSTEPGKVQHASTPGGKADDGTAAGKTIDGRTQPVYQNGLFNAFGYPAVRDPWHIAYVNEENAGYRTVITNN